MAPRQLKPTRRWYLVVGLDTKIQSLGRTRVCRNISVHFLGLGNSRATGIRTSKSLYQEHVWSSQLVAAASVLKYFFLYSYQSERIGVPIAFRFR